MGLLQPHGRHSGRDGEADLIHRGAANGRAFLFHAAIKAAADGPMKGVLAYTSEKLVSIDFNHCPASSTFHLDQTKVMDGNLASVLSWYDNEWGFSARMTDTAAQIGKFL